MLPQNHTELVQSLRNGDDESFTALYNDYSKKMFLTAYTATKSKETAKEITQDIFVALWASRETLSIKSSIEAYLIGAVRHKVYDYFDKQTVRERYKNRVAHASSPMINVTEEVLQFEELNSLVNLQLERLPETTRKVFVSSRFNGATIPEIAKETSLSVKAVEYHLTKALKHLRLRLASYQPGTSEVAVLIIVLLALF